MANAPSSPCPFYSFSWEPFYTAPELHPSGQRVVKYLHKVAAKYGMQDKIQLNTDVTDCAWSEEEQLWTATLSHMAPGMGDMGAKDRFAYIAKHGEGAVYLKQEMIKAKIIISCVGGLVEPKSFPENILGSQDFKGDIFHAARWNTDVDLTGKDVVIVGTGCSAAQVVPTILKEPYDVKSVTQLMKSPPWVVPKPEELGGKEWYKNNAPTLFTYAPFLGWMLRETLAARGEWDWFTLFLNTRWNDRYRKGVDKQMVDRMKKITPEKYHEVLTPNYSIGCKRRIFDSEWYQSMHNDKFRLTTQKLTRVTPNGLILGSEKHYPPGAAPAAADEEIKADVIVLANGYETQTWLHPLIVKGRDGHTIHEVWKERGGPQAYLGTAMDGFPNFFMIFGPNIVTGHSSVIMQSENGILYTIKLIAPLIKGNARAVEVKKEAEVAYTARVQRELKNTVFLTGGCGSWYFDPKTGWNATAYP
jgi:cation diffusion facilitator CzcD-associated flavoprotein CzcO